MKRLTFASLALTATACANLPDDELRLGQTTQAVVGDDCESWHCGMNSPIINGLGFHDLNYPTPSTPSLPNNAGLKVVKFTRYGVVYDFRVTGGRFVAWNSNMVLTNLALKDSLIWLRDANLQTYILRISDVDDTLDYWAQNGSSLPSIENYLLEFAIANSSGAPVTGFRNVCYNPPPARSSIGAPNPDLLGMNRFRAVVFEGDVIHADKKVIEPVMQPTWFNIGCAGHALAKLHLTGHTDAARIDGLPTTVDERQTMLKMLTGDFCGDGFPYTVPGQPLHWADHHGWMTAQGSDTLEARWTRDGAACVVEPRVNVHDPGMQAFPGGIDPQTMCGPVHGAIPACANLSVTDTAGYHLLSANPP